jgi:multidrug efflux pump subunit AcrB
MDSVEELENIPVAFNNGQPVLLRSVGNVTEGTTPGQYERYNMERMITVTANLDGDLGSVAEQVRAAIAELGAGGLIAPDAAWRLAPYRGGGARGQLDAE